MLQRFEAGEEPAILTKYREKRDSEEWRSSQTVEALCEYILYLESCLEGWEYDS